MPDVVWRPYAAAAYAGFLDKGRGVFVVDLDLEDIAKPTPAPEYIPFADLKSADKPLRDAAKLVQTYSPETAMVLMFRASGKNSIAPIVIGNSSPRQCYEKYIKG